MTRTSLQTVNHIGKKKNVTLGRPLDRCFFLNIYLFLKSINMYITVLIIY